MNTRRFSSAFARRSRAGSSVRQRGSVLVAAGGAMLVSVILLASADLGYLFYMKREVQKAADLAALAGAQALQPTGCTEAVAAASENAALNGITLAATSPDPIRCGRWDPNPDADENSVGSLEASPETYGGGGGQKFFGEPKTLPDGTFAARNAVRVTINRSTPAFLPFMGSHTVHAEAIAMKGPDVAAFSVGSRLVRLYPKGLLYNVLATLGLQADQIDALSAAGLANANIAPTGLLAALGLPPTAILDVGTANEALALRELKLGALLQASIDALTAKRIFGAQVAALEALKAELDVSALELPVRLFGSPDKPGIFAEITAPDKTGALHAEVNVLDLLGTSISVANGKNLIDAPYLNIAGLIQGKVRIIEPPTIAIGGIGASATSAQIRVYVRVSTSNIPLVGSLLDGLNTGVDLPLIVEVAQSTGTLTNLCKAPLDPRGAEIDVQSSAANLCLGGFSGMDSNTENDFFSPTTSCTKLVERHKILDILGLLPLKSKVALPILQSGTESVELSLPDNSNTTVSPKNNVDLNTLGTTLASEIGTGLLGDLLGARGTTGVSAASDNTAFAQKLLGSPPGNSLVAVRNELVASGQALNNANQQADGVLPGIATLLGNLTGTLGSGISDTLCGVVGGIFGGADGIYRCKLGHVEDMIEGESAVTALLGVVVQALKPALDALSTLLQSVLNDLLGLGIGESDVSLLSVNCGAPRLVY